MSTITDRQRSFAVKLLSERLVTLGAPTLEHAITGLHLDALTVADARIVIDRLLKIAVDPDTTMPALVAQSPRKGVNGRDGACTACNNVVPAGAGFFYLNAQQRFSVIHKNGECGAIQAVTPVAEIVAGLYRIDGGTEPVIALVYLTGNNRLAGKRQNRRGKFDYALGLVMQVRQAVASGKAHAVTATEARSYGYANSHCIACGLALTDPRSDPLQGGAGYGPVCAAKYGWPWG